MKKLSLIPRAELPSRLFFLFFFRFISRHATFQSLMVFSFDRPETIYLSQLSRAINNLRERRKFHFCFVLFKHRKAYFCTRFSRFRNIERDARIFFFFFSIEICTSANFGRD